MNLNDELNQLEEIWAPKLEQFTTAEPTQEQTLQLIQSIKEKDQENMLPDMRRDLEAIQANQSRLDKITQLFLSQWTFYGATSWLLTGIVMLIITMVMSENTSNPIQSFSNWVQWMSFVVIALISFSFRSKNEGNTMIEQISYYPLTLQLFTRFLIVMVYQFVFILPLCYVLLGKESTVLYVVGSLIPVFFFGAIGFVSTFWCGQKRGLVVTLIVWVGHWLVKEKDLFQLPGMPYFYQVNLVMLLVSVLLLSTIVMKDFLKR